jgi:hypothetical protein
MKHYTTKEVEKICPSCARKMKLQKKDGITLPDNYFDTKISSGAIKLKLGLYKYNKKLGRTVKVKDLKLEENANGTDK